MTFLLILACKFKQILKIQRTLLVNWYQTYLVLSFLCVVTFLKLEFKNLNKSSHAKLNFYLEIHFKTRCYRRKNVLTCSKPPILLVTI